MSQSSILLHSIVRSSSGELEWRLAGHEVYYYGLYLCPLRFPFYPSRSLSNSFMNTSIQTISPHVLMSSYAQPQAFSPTHSSLHFPLSSPPLHIPHSLQSLETPSSSGFMYARRGRTRHSDASSSTFESSRRELMSSMESLPALSRRTSQPTQEYKVSKLHSSSASFSS